MKLTKQEKVELLADGNSTERRDHFRLGGQARTPASFEAYLAALDDLQISIPRTAARTFVAYLNVKL